MAVPNYVRIERPGRSPKSLSVSRFVLVRGLALRHLGKTVFRQSLDRVRGRQERPALPLAAEGPLLSPQHLLHNERIHRVTIPPYPYRRFTRILAVFYVLDPVIEQAELFEQAGFEYFKQVNLLNYSPSEAPFLPPNRWLAKAGWPSSVANFLVKR